MKKLAFVFPGQGSQAVGMGKDFYDSGVGSASLFDHANELLSYKLTKIMFEGPEELLHQTVHAQPAIVLTSAVILDCFLRAMQSKNSINDKILCAGHSLGEFTAYYAAAVCSFEDILRLVQKRGQLMDSEALQNSGQMLAILGLNEQDITEVCQHASEYGQIFPANFNCPGQVVVSGETLAIQKAQQLALQKKAKLAKILNVSGAFHSPLMQHAAQQLEISIDATTFHEPRMSIVSNVTAEELHPKDIKASLKKHMLSPVYWQRSVQRMIQMGVTVFIEIGHGQVLRKLIGKIDPSVELLGIDNLESLEKTVTRLTALGIHDHIFSKGDN